MNDLKILILGANGQLGRQFQKELLNRNINYLAPNKKECDITLFDNIRQFIETRKPNYIINCAAYNAVDNAESNSELVFLINHKSVENIAKICKDNNIFFIHYSSDYVFDGRKGDLYSESDSVNPLNVYGKSKLAGENSVLDILNNSLVLRLSWAYGDGNQNFIYKLKDWASKNHILKISNDEVSIPTNTYDIVNATLDLIKIKATGLFHLTNSNYCSRYEWARFVLDTLNLDNIIIPVPMSNFQSLAQRPLFSPMLNDKICSILNYKLPDWRTSTQKYLIGDL
jgi:dTDP-4-dehydrorhamnose reductase